MHVMDLHKEQVAYANKKTFDRFNINGPYKAGSDAHEYWLKCFDERLMEEIKEDI